MKVFKRFVLLFVLSSLFGLEFLGYTDATSGLSSDNTVSAQSQQYYFAGPSGGQGGGFFNDTNFLPSGKSEVKQIAIRSGKYIDGINIGHRLPNGTYKYPNWHGGTGGQPYTFNLREGEKITFMQGRYGKYVDQIQFHTNFGRSSPKYGGSGGKAVFYYSAPPGCEIAGFNGRSGKYIDAIGVILRCG